VPKSSMARPTPSFFQGLQGFRRLRSGFQQARLGEFQLQCLRRQGAGFEQPADAVGETRLAEVAGGEG
jgi:hypothetical protein